MPIDATEQIEKFKEFIETSYQKILYELVRKGKKALIIDFAELAQFDSDLSEQLLNHPDETIRAAELSIEQFDLPEEVTLRVRFTNLPPSQEIMVRDIRSAHINILVAVDGIIRQASDVRPQVVSAKFECPACGNTITILQLDSKFKEPSRCSCGRRGNFRLLSKELVDAQRLVIEEAPESLVGGEQPKRISVFLREDLVEPKMEKRTTPGSKIKVYGVIKEVPLPAKTGGQLTRYDLVIEANYITPLEETFEDIEFTEEDQKKIFELANDPKIYEYLINSIAPSIYGHEDIKEALVLQLMGGVKKERKDGTRTRGDMHILLVGDPGAAKSTLLTFISKAAPKARYISGKGVSGAGVTAAVVKDEFLRGWALEAGALVLANKGILCLDEMDKMSEEDTSALHEAMAQQQISISKANIQATLKAETTVLAAANPKLGRFDPYQPIASQIDLPPALINRFDLIFPVRDIPDRVKDEKIAGHVLSLQQNIEGKQPEIPIDLLKKYILFSRQKINPRLSDSAVEEIKSFYVTLRNTGTTGDETVKPIPISARQLEALVRLSEGSARARLSKTVTKKDARKAIYILRRCLMQVGFDYETGQMDIDQISTGISASQRGKIITVREIINELASKGKKTIPIEDIIAEAAEKGIDEARVEEIIEKLKREGSIFEPKRGFLSPI